MFTNLIDKNGLNRLALVGANSQGKSYIISKEVKSVKDKKVIYITNEVKADENLKNSSDSSTLIEWLNTLLDNTKAKKALQNEINKVDLSSINNNSFLNISLQNNLESYKGIISAEIETDSNKWKKPGSGERFLGQLLLISKILEDNMDNTYKYLVIDEPEQHLHPSLYIKIAKILNKISHQGIVVIIATHSPIITQYFIEDTNEIVMVSNGEMKQLKSKDEYIKLAINCDCYTDDVYKFKDYSNIEGKFNLYFDNFVMPAIIKSLFCKCIMLGEGAVEKKIFELYINKYVSNMEKNDITYYITDGKPFIPIYLNIFRELGIKTLTIFDEDIEKQSIHKCTNDTIIDLSDDVLVFKPNIETSLGISKENFKDKYRTLTILINEMYINSNYKLLSLLKDIDEKINLLICDSKK